MPLSALAGPSSVSQQQNTLIGIEGTGGRLSQGTPTKRGQLLRPMPCHLVGPSPLTVRNRGGHYIFLNDPERGTVRAMINELGDLVEPEALHPFFD